LTKNLYSNNNPSTLAFPTEEEEEEATVHESNPTESNRIESNRTEHDDLPREENTVFALADRCSAFCGRKTNHHYDERKAPGISSKARRSPGARHGTAQGTTRQPQNGQETTRRPACRVPEKTNVVLQEPDLRPLQGLDAGGNFGVARTRTLDGCDAMRCNLEEANNDDADGWMDEFD